MDEDAAVTRSQWNKPIAVTLANKGINKQEEPITEAALEEADVESKEDQVVASQQPEHYNSVTQLNMKTDEEPEVYGGTLAVFNPKKSKAEDVAFVQE